MERINLLKIAHCLRLDGMGAYRATMIEYAEKINQLQEQVEELQNQLSAEIMTRLASPIDATLAQPVRPNNAVHLTPAAAGSCATEDDLPQAQVTADR